MTGVQTCALPILVGGSGAGKSRTYAIPNIMQCNCSMVITDPKAELLRKTGGVLERNGYEVRVFDLINPETISCRYNPGGLFKISNDIMDNPGDAKYGMTTEQLFEAFKILKAKGAKKFGIHAFLASNTVTNEYYPMLAKVLFEVAVKLEKETGADIEFINLSGGVGIPYKPDQEPNDIRVIGEGVRKVYEEVLVPEIGRASCRERV